MILQSVPLECPCLCTGAKMEVDIRDSWVGLAGRLKPTHNFKQKLNYESSFSELQDFKIFWCRISLDTLQVGTPLVLACKPPPPPKKKQKTKYTLPCQDSYLIFSFIGVAKAERALKLDSKSSVAHKWCVTLCSGICFNTLSSSLSSILLPLNASMVV